MTVVEMPRVPRAVAEVMVVVMAVARAAAAADLPGDRGPGPVLIRSLRRRWISAHPYRSLQSLGRVSVKVRSVRRY